MEINRIITSQDYIDDTLVAEKIAAGDFTCQVSPEFEIDGEMYRVLLDGHHSFAAAVEAGVEPEIVEQTASENDRIALLEAGNIDDFLTVTHMGADYRYVATGLPVW